MSFGAKVGPDMVGLWLWPLAALYVLRIAKGADPRWWIAAGAAIGAEPREQIQRDLLCAARWSSGWRSRRQRRIDGLAVVRGRRGARRRDRVAELPMASVSRFSDVGAAAQRPNGKNVVAGPASICSNSCC